MQLSELLGRDVLGPDEHRLGTVVDVRLAVTGELDDHPHAPALFGLVISPRTSSSYLGYERSDARKPRVLAALLRWRHRGTFLVRWAGVARVQDRAVRLRRGFQPYSPILRDDDGRSPKEPTWPTSPS